MIRGDSGTLTVSIVNSQGEEVEAPEMVLSIRKRLESNEYALQVPFDLKPRRSRLNTRTRRNSSGGITFGILSVERTAG